MHTDLSEKKFKRWLVENGADVLAATNQWEFARFKAHDAVHIVYQNKRHQITASGFAQECLTAYTQGKGLKMGFSSVRRTVSDRTRIRLLNRDGDRCFFCNTPIGDDVTIEHLVAVAKGGPTHSDNLALAHARCNHEAGGKSLMEKITMYCTSHKDTT